MVAATQAVKSPRVHCRLKDAHKLKTIFEGLKDMVHEVTIDFDPDGRLCMQAMDSSRIVLISFSLEKAAFSKFDVQQFVSVQMEIGHAARLFYPCEQGQECDLYLDKRGEFILSAEFYDSKDDISNTMWLQTGNGDDQSYDTPDVSQANHVLLPSVEFQKIMKDYIALNDGEEIMLNCTDKQITFKMGGLGNTSGQITYEHGQTVNKDMEVSFSRGFPQDFLFKQKFNLKLLGRIAKIATASSEECAFYTGCGDLPFGIGCGMGINSSHGHVLFFIANKMGDDDEY